MKGNLIQVGSQDVVVVSTVSKIDATTSDLFSFTTVSISSISGKFNVVAVEVEVLETPLNQIRFRMNLKRYGDEECRDARARPWRSVRRPHVLGITL